MNAATINRPLSRARRDSGWTRSMPLAFGLLFAITAVVLIRATGLFAGWQPTSGALVGRALLGAAGKMSLGELIAAYPPMALMPMIALRLPADAMGLTMGDLYAALVGAALAALWLGSLLRAGYNRGAALALVLLLVANPLFLGALTAGPEAVLTLVGAWLFAMTAFTLRNRGSVNDLIACSASLALLWFAGSLGGAFAAATLPFLLLLMPADIARRKAGSVYLVLLFPVLFGIAGFLFVNWMMVHDPIGFLRTDMDLSARWIGQTWLTPVVPILFAVACAPALVGMFILSRGRRPIQSVASALLGMLLVAVTLALQTGATRSPLEALCPAVSLAAAAAMRWPPQKTRALRVGLLLALGAAGGLSALLAQGPLSLGDTQAARGGTEFVGINRIADEQRVGRFLASRDDVLVDAVAHPALVAARGRAEGLVAGNDTDFALMLLRKRVEAQAVAVAAPNPARNADAVSRNLPGLYAQGAPGYRLVYDAAGWRVWERKDNQ